MDSSETYADGYVPLEYEDVWSEERRFVARSGEGSEIGEG